MFTGIISDIGTIESAKRISDTRLTISCHFDSETIKLGESIACNGACMTVVEVLKNPTRFAIDISDESIACTAPSQWQAGKKINLERPMKLGATLDGHLVTGHVDGVATLISIEIAAGSHTLCIEAPAALSRYIAAKGSVTVNGVALTVNKVDGAHFWVNIIPHTWENTTFSLSKMGDGLNLEIDLIARYVERLMAK